MDINFKGKIFVQSHKYRNSSTEATQTLNVDGSADKEMCNTHARTCTHAHTHTHLPTHTCQQTIHRQTHIYTNRTDGVVHSLVENSKVHFYTEIRFHSPKVNVLERELEEWVKNVRQEGQR